MRRRILNSSFRYLDTSQQALRKSSMLWTRSTGGSSKVVNALDSINGGARRKSSTRWTRSTPGSPKVVIPANAWEPWTRTSARIPRLQEYSVDQNSIMKAPVVYILASKPRGALYIGVTSDLVKRIWQHREGLSDGFTKRHNIKTLVWYEQHQTMANAIGREKAIKRWRRREKLVLIYRTNPTWRDLWNGIVGKESIFASIAQVASATPATVGCAPISSSMVPTHSRG